MREIDAGDLKAAFDARMTLVDIAEKFGVCVMTIHRRLKKLGLSRTRLSLVEDIAGNVYGRLTALRFERLDKFGKAMWLTRCECGKEKVLNASAMKAGLTTSCGCRKRAVQRKGVGDLSQAYWRKLEKSALQRDLAFDVTKQEAVNQLSCQEGVCALSGVPIVLFPDGDRYRLQTASLDRIDSTKGYVAGNIQWVHKRVNFLKRDYSEQELIYWCCKIAARNLDRFVDISDCIPQERRPLRADIANNQAT